MPVTEPISWPTLRGTIFDWFSGATGLEGIWSDQDQPQPPYPYFSLNVMSGPTRIGGRDDVINTTLGSGAAAQSQLTHQGPRHFVVGCQIHVSQKMDQFGTRQEPTADCNARSLMGSAEFDLELQATKKAFKACALAFIRIVGDPLSLDLPIDGEFVTRVQMDVEFATTARVQEFETFIENATITGTITPPGGAPIVDDFSVDTDP